MSSPEMENRKTYPLTSSQMSIFMAWKYSFHKQVMNIPTSFLTDSPLDLDVLKKAAAEAVSRNDAFGIRITKQGKERVQYFTDRKVLVLEKLTLPARRLSRWKPFSTRLALQKCSSMTDRWRKYMSSGHRMENAGSFPASAT